MTDLDSLESSPRGEGTLLKQWQQVKSTGMPPRQRSLHVGIVLNDCLWIFGGYDGSNRVNDLYKFDFKRSKWSQIQTQSSPSVRDRHVVVAYKDSLYIFGGYDGNNRVNDFWEFDTVRSEWAVVSGEGMPPSARHSHAGVEYNGCTYIFAGYDGNYRNDFHEFNFSTRRWSLVNVRGQQPKARYRTSAASYKNKMVVIGGHDGQKHLNDFYQFDFDTEVWSLVEVANGFAPSPRDSHSACVYGDCLYLFGGSTGHARNDLYEFRFDSNTWAEIKPLAASSGQQQTFVGAAGAAGGVNEGANDQAADRPQSSRGSTPCPRFCHTGVVYNSCLYIFGGYDGHNRLNDFRAFRLVDEINVEIPPTTLVSDLRNALNDPKFSDVTFTLDDGREIHAHKLLCMRCLYFKAMFEGSLREATQRVIPIKNIAYEVFHSLLEYLYTDDIEINLSMAMDLFVAADQFGVERLKKLCEKKILVSINTENAATISAPIANFLQAANMHHALGLRQSCMEFILTHFDTVSKTSAFEGMGRNNVELVFEILKRR
ncbi:unnamed protein product [Amoebophrya sp. A25]|nr:unnamed protein product [Amoebophrya sp. A25]|eukprot:GSA25T00008243001.1